MDVGKIDCVAGARPSRTTGREAKHWARDMVKGARVRAYPPIVDRWAIAGVRRDLEREDSRDPASGAASGSTERTSA